MASTAAVLNIMVAANTAPASAQLTALQGQLAKTTAQANTTSATVGGGLSKGGKMAAVGLGAAAVAAIGVGKALTASVGAARSFESSFAEVRKTVDTNEAGFRRIERGLRNLAKQIPTPVEELNNLAGEAGALGIAAKDIVAFTKVASQLGTTTDMSSSDAANALARLANIMGTSSNRFENMASALVGLGNAGASTESEIAAMALRIASTGKQVGLTESDVLGFASALSSVGIEAEAGGSAISRAFSMISEAVATGNEKLAGFAKVSEMSVPSFSRLFEKDAAKAMLAFIKGLGEIKKNGGNALVELEKLGINEIRLRNALLSAAGAGDLFNKQLKISSSEFAANSALSEEAQKRYATFDSQVALLKNSLKDLGITIGLAVLPTLKDMVKAANDVLGSELFKDGLSVAGKTIKGTFQLFSRDFDGFFDTITGKEKKMPDIFQRMREDAVNAMDYLKMATGQEQSLRARQKAAIAGVQKAQQRLNHARKQHGPNSTQAAVAEAELAGAMNRSVKAQKRLTRAEQTTGAVRRATKAIITDQVGQIKIEIAQNRKLINQKDRRIEQLKREQPGSREIIRLQGKIVDLADRNQSKQGKLNKLILEAANKVGPKFANSLERLTTRTANIRGALNELPAPLRKMGGTAETQFDRAGKSAKGFRGAIDRTKKRVNDDLRGMPPVLRSSTGTMMEIFRDRMDALGTYGKPRVSKRAGGVIRGTLAKFAAGGLVPAAVSPGEMISYKGSSMVVPGRPEPKDSVLMGLPTGAKVFTWDGQKRLLEGASEAEALRKQAPHFAKGGIVKPEIMGGSRKSNRLANTQVGIIHKRASSILESAQERSRASSSGAAFIGPPPGMAQLGNNAWVDSNTWTVASYLANKFGLQISSNYRSPAHNAAVGGVPNSSHTRGTPSNPGAFDFVPASSAMQSFAGQRVAGIVENLIHDVGSGLHNHIAFFQRGGMVNGIRRMATGGEVVRQAAPILNRRGFDHKAAAGILGNAWGESSWNPGATGYGGGGLFGFTTSPVSLADMQAYAASKGKAWTDVPTQIKFMLGHGQPTGMAMKGPLNALDSIPATTEKFMVDWERPGIPRLDERIKGGFMASDIMRDMNLRDAEEEKKIEAIKAGVAKALARIKSLRGRGAKGYLNAAVDNAQKANKLAGDGKVKQAKARLQKARAQIRTAIRKGKKPGQGSSRPAQEILASPSIAAQQRVIETISERITDFERAAGAEWSPAEGEYDQAEIGGLRALYVQLRDAYLVQKDLIEKDIERVQALINARAKKIADLRAKIANWQNDIEALQYSISGGVTADQAKKWRERIDELQKKIKGPGSKAQKDEWRDEVKRLENRLAGPPEEDKKKWQKQINDIRGYIKKAGGTIGTHSSFIGDAQTLISDTLRPDLDALVGFTGESGLIGDTNWEILNLDKMVPGSPNSPADGDSEIADLLRQQLQETQRALAISQAQMPIFQQFMPRFHQGGIVQGPMGAERPVMAQAGEGVFTRDQMRAMGSQNITVVIEDAAIDSNRIRVEVDGVIQDKVSTVRRQGSNRKFVTSR